jgi:hypothetical protein
VVYETQVPHDQGYGLMTWAAKALRKFVAQGIAQPLQAFCLDDIRRPTAVNQRELQEAGYSDTVTLPLLVDSRRLEGDSAVPHFIERSKQHTYYLCVGRLA